MKPAIDKLRELAPCYVYDAGAIETACSALTRALPQFDFLYSVKANPFAPVVRTAAACGLGADASSPAEVGIAAACGIAPEDIYYSAPGKTESDLRRAPGKCTVIADSLGELRLVERIAAEAGTTAEVGLRVHPAFGLGGAGGPSKFGIDVAQARGLADMLASCPHVQAVGIPNASRMGRGADYSFADLTADDMHAVLESRDDSFAGVFFVGVTSTGVYCRPGCRAKVPMQKNCRYFATAAEAEAAGFRACKLCHPEKLKAGA